MGRKRKGVPERLDPAKQLKLAWKMSDLSADALRVVPDNDPTLRQEATNAANRPVASTSSQPGKIRSCNLEIQRMLAHIHARQCCIQIRHKTPFKENEWYCHLGTFSLHVPMPNSGSHDCLPEKLPDGLDFWLYVSSKSERHLIYFESNDPDIEGLIDMDDKRVMYFQALANVSFDLLEGLKLKALPLEIWNYNAFTGTFEIRIMATEAALVDLQFSSEGIRPKKINKSILNIMAELHGFQFNEYDPYAKPPKPDMREFYGEIKARHAAENLNIDINVQHTNLRPRLRQYQKDAVVWMLHRENVDTDAVNFDPEKLHFLYEEFYTEDKQLLYYNRHGGYLVKKKPLSIATPTGGILADEMGLGKTVEVLACMMSHPRRDLPALEELPVVAEEESSSDGEEGDGQNTDESIKQEKNSPQQTDGVSGTASKDEDKGMAEGDYPAVQFDHDYCQISPVKAEQTEGKEGEEKAENKEPAADVKDKKDSTGKKVKNKRRQSRQKELDSKTKEEKNDQSNSDVCEVVDKVQAEEDTESPEQSSITNDTSSIEPSTPADDNSSEPVVSIPFRVVKSKPKKKKQIGFVTITEDEESKDSKFFDEAPIKQKAVFECICGLKSSVDADTDEKSRVQCLSCGLWQHPDCVKYDLKDPYRGPYLCPHCHVVSTPVPSGATLIISPNSICHQWVDEIHKHIHQERLKVLVYGGVHVHGFLQPQSLAQHDIVITSYETLQKEINYVDLPHSNSQAGRRFRHPKRFMAVPSPLIAVEWWRICLDEAQMVECTTTKSAEMALRLSAVNRWCVTGTPVQKGLNDLYGLLLFLGEDPFWVNTWWNRLLYQPYGLGDKLAMHEAMGKVLWRTNKDDVIDQICLPTQSEEIHWLTFSPIEDHFYKQTFSQCARVGLRSLSKWQDTSIKLNTVDRYTLHALLGPLTRIRQACCHPQAVRGSFLPIQKSTMTMEELLVSMTKKARLECEEAHRQLNAAMNGLAGLHIIREEYVEAVDMYREVLRSIAEHKDQFRTDPLQNLHTLQNLDEVLTLKPEGVHPTLRDDKLKEEATELRKKYLLKAASFVEQAAEAWTPIRKSLREIRAEVAGGEDWWADLLQWVIYIGSDELLIERVKTELLDKRSPGNVSLASSFRDARGLEYVMANELEALDSAHEGLIDSLKSLEGHPSDDLIDSTVECCLRPARLPLKTCPFCKANELFDVYENKLFSFTDKGVSEVSGLEGESIFQVGTRRQGTWADSEAERILKSIMSFVKGYGGTPSLSDGRKLTDVGASHLKLLEALKKEFKVVRTLWIELRAQVSAHDELDMATTRLRLRLPEEPVPDPPQPNILEPAELDSQRLKVQSDKIIAQNLLRKKMGQLMYLKNLAKASTDMEGGENPEPCPICQRTLGKKWAVLACGHCYCLDCVRVMVQQCSVGGPNARLKCPMCRQGTRFSDINYVSTAVTDQEEDTSIKGDHSTKVEGVVRFVQDILKKDSSTKILVFSMWQNVLNILAQAFTDNDIRHVSLLANNKFQRNLSQFKTLDYINVLLLPVHSGANGLNLIEATHVLLVEPILNHGQELQAIGRVHRIGQTKPTFVHRFLVRDTIEERLHHLLSVRAAPTTASNNADETPFTVGDLKALYLESHDPDLEEDGHDNMILDLEEPSGDDEMPSLEGADNQGMPNVEMPQERSIPETTAEEREATECRAQIELASYVSTQEEPGADDDMPPLEGAQEGEMRPEQLILDRTVEGLAPTEADGVAKIESASYTSTQDTAVSQGENAAEVAAQESTIQSDLMQDMHMEDRVVTQEGMLQEGALSVVQNGPIP